MRLPSITTPEPLTCCGLLLVQGLKTSGVWCTALILTTKSRILSCADTIDGCKAKKLHIIRPITVRCIDFPRFCGAMGGAYYIQKRPAELSRSGLWQLHGANKS